MRKGRNGRKGPKPGFISDCVLTGVRAASKRLVNANASRHPSAKKAAYCENAVVAALSQPRYVKVARAAAAKQAKNWPAGGIIRIETIGKGSLDDIGVTWSWRPSSNAPVSARGEYQINYKQESRATRAKVRIAKRELITNIVVGQDMPRRRAVSVAQILDQAYTDGHQFGGGVLAFYGAIDPEVLVYDWAFTYAVDPWGRGRPPQHIHTIKLPASRAKRITDLYLTEGELLQIHHAKAHDRWPETVAWLMNGAGGYDHVDFARAVVGRHCYEVKQKSKKIMRDKDALLHSLNNAA